jgi:hypothetical protein
VTVTFSEKGLLHDIGCSTPFEHLPLALPTDPGYQASIPDVNVLRTQIAHSTKKVTSHTLERARAETEYRIHVLRLTKGQKSEVLITNFVPLSVKYNKLYHLFFNNFVLQ